MKKIVLMLFVSTLTIFAVSVGEVPKEVSIEKKDGGHIDGTTWNSSMIKDKIYVLFYVDPDEKDTNNPFSEALKAKKYDREKFASIAIINLAATWLPNFAIEATLKKKQKEYPDTIYVKDKNKVLVKEWSLKDDSSNIVVFDKDGKVLYSFSGKLGEEEIKKALIIIDDHLL